MSFIRSTRTIERQQFFDGQRLAAADMQGIEAFNREMRWLHNQSLHQPGIGNGFAVSGHKGDREVRIGPGYAIDDLGREIVLTRERVLPVPPVAGAKGAAQRYLLTIAYPEDDELEIVEQRLGVCAEPGATRLRIEPVFCWQPLNPDGTPRSAASEIVAGRQLTIAEIAVKDCQLDREVSIVTRRNAKPAIQPYICAGEETPTFWEPWIPLDVMMSTIGTSGSNIPLRLIAGVQAWIDTSVAGFLSQPEYFCRIAGPRLFQIEQYGEYANITFAVDGMAHIEKATADGFLARVLLLYLGNTAGIEDDVEFMGAVTRIAMNGEAIEGAEGGLTLPWTVVWMGVEG